MYENYPNGNGENYIPDGQVNNNAGYNGNYSGRYSGTDSLGGNTVFNEDGTYRSGSLHQNAAGGQGAGSGSGRYTNHYPNDYYGQGAGSSAYSADTHTEQGKDMKLKKKGGGLFKKVLVCSCMGLCFGLFAGLTMLAVDRISENARAIESGGSEEKALTSSGSAENAGKVLTTSNTVTTVVSDVTGVVQNVMPSVVSIVNKFTENISYFGQNLSQQEETASGSGIIVGKSDKELLIVTNYHVVAEADELIVSFYDDTTAKAVLKGSDSGMDLAVLAIQLDELSGSTMEAIEVARLGDSDNLTVGEPVIAIGNALGYGQSVTTGVVSALNREIAMSDTTSGTFIQTDAAINPGNSGGALLNINGEVIGINSNKIGGSTIEGMGYAIPISSAKPIIEELMNKETRTKVGEDKKGYLGISGVTVTPEVSAVYGMPEGAYLAQVYPGTGAAEAGLQQGDIITQLSDYKIGSMDDLSNALEYFAVGDTVTITFMRNGLEGYESLQTTLTLGNKTE